ncbi:YabN family protein [Sphingomonas sp. 28-63-12]|uniref:nucleoside triphosphate pyrophosphohydrolase n=1 Tax=Sphingomonas sp. 28-63-12 TaxID=1970434 RepID=UPI000BD03D61|nr:MAG: nucleoside triphosphate pyrophosphohydrolase [Sphingomonas sp. 28-63-12]
MVDRLVTIMARLRDPVCGCAWDIAQDFASIAPYTIEEAHEVADAIERGDMADLKDELGDLLLQVVFHSRMAEEAGYFALDEVVTAICDKMERRHPHIFASTAGDNSAPAPPPWEQIKTEERAAKASSAVPAGALDGVARGLPALMRAEKLQKRAARTGFDWPDTSGPRAKVIEELAEVDAATSGAQQAEEIGDLLFAVVNWARHLGIDAEAALRQGNRKFEHRFKAMEAIAGNDFEGLTLSEKEMLWQSIKARVG